MLHTNYLSRFWACSCVHTGKSSKIKYSRGSNQIVSTLTAVDLDLEGKYQGKTWRGKYLGRDSCGTGLPHFEVTVGDTGKCQRCKDGLHKARFTRCRVCYCSASCRLHNPLPQAAPPAVCGAEIPQLLPPATLNTSPRRCTNKWLFTQVQSQLQCSISTFPLCNNVNSTVQPVSILYWAFFVVGWFN